MRRVVAAIPPGGQGRCLWSWKRPSSLLVSSRHEEEQVAAAPGRYNVAEVQHLLCISADKVPGVHNRVPALGLG